MSRIGNEIDRITAKHLAKWPLTAEERLIRAINGLGNHAPIDANEQYKMECRSRDIRGITYFVYPDVVNLDMTINYRGYENYPCSTFALVKTTYEWNIRIDGTQAAMKRAWYFAYRNYRRMQNTNELQFSVRDFYSNGGIKREFRVKTWSDKI